MLSLQVSRLFASLSLAAAIAVAPLAVSAQERLVFSAVDSDPSFSATLGAGSPLYIKIAYRSERPVRFRAEGYRGDQKVEDGAMYNPAPIYAAGSGEALVWIAYRKPTALDAILVTAVDDNWKRLSTVSVPVKTTWSAEPARGAPRTSWATRMSAAQQEAAVTPSKNDVSSPQFDFLGLAILLCVPGYFVLQAALPLRLRGGWRKAALVPLVGAIPALLHAMTALAAGSNIWPVVFILFSLLACLYLSGLLALKFVLGNFVARPAAR
jgi:hypothetical protein